MRSTKELKATNGENCAIFSKKEMSKPAGVKKPIGKARALWRMKAARDSGGDLYDPERKDNIFGKK